MTTPIFDISTITEVYTGRPGCQCGCKGEYKSIANGQLRSVKIIAGKLARNTDTQYDARAKCWFLKTSTRNLVAYHA